LRSARNRIRGRRSGFRLRLQRLWNSFQAIWKATKRLPRSGGQRQKNPIAAVRHRLQHSLDGDVLVVAALEIPTPVLERNRGKPITPGVLLGKGLVPELVRCRKASDLSFSPIP